MKSNCCLSDGVSAEALAMRRLRAERKEKGICQDCGKFYTRFGKNLCVRCQRKRSRPFTIWIGMDGTVKVV